MKDILKLPVLLQEAIRAEMLTERHANILKEISNHKLLLIPFLIERFHIDAHQTLFVKS